MEAHMFSDPFLPHKDVLGVGVAQRSYDRLPSDGSNNTIYKATASNPQNVETIRFAHQKVGNPSARRQRHLISLEGPQIIDDSNTEDPNLPKIKIQVVFDIPDSALEFGTEKIEYMTEQMLGMVRGNSINDATVATVFGEFLTPFLAGQS
jgi:hypothetical protein